VSFVLLIILSFLHTFTKIFHTNIGKRKKKRINITIPLQGTPKTKNVKENKRMNKAQKTGVGNLQKNE